MKKLSVTALLTSQGPALTMKPFQNLSNLHAFDAGCSKKAVKSQNNFLAQLRAGTHSRGSVATRIRSASSYSAGATRTKP
jgi:hypothetical protein